MPELIAVLSGQHTGAHKPGGRLPLRSTWPVIINKGKQWCDDVTAVHHISIHIHASFTASHSITVQEPYVVFLHCY